MLRRLASALALTVVALPVQQAAAQESATGFVRVASMTPWTDATRPFVVTLQLTNTTEAALEDVTVTVTLSSPVITRSELRSVLDGTVASGSIATVARALTETIEPGSQRTVTVRREMADLTARGLYPLTITVAHSAGSETITSALPHFVPSEAGPITVAWTLPITAPSLAEPAAATDEDVARLGLEVLAQQARAIAARPGAAVTLAPSPSLLETAATLAGMPDAPGNAAAEAFLGAVRAAAAAVGEVATVPYAPADLRALARHGPPGDVLRQVTLGRTAVATTLGEDPSPSILVPPGFALDDAAIAALAPAGITGAIVDPALLIEPPEEPADLQPQLFGPSAPVTVGPDGAVRALLPDVFVRTRIDDGQSGVLLGQGLIAETLGAWQELPSFAPRRAMVVASSSLPDPTALAHALDGLASAPWVQMRTASDTIAALEAEVEPSGLQRVARPDTPPLAAARAARAALEVLRQIAPGATPETATFDRLIMIAESSEWDADPDTGIAIAAAAQQHVQGILDDIRVASRRVTLTSKTGDLPITIVNDNAFEVSVRLRLEATAVGFPDGDMRMVELTPGDNTIAVAVEARGSGSFPLTIFVETPAGDRVLASGTYQVRSTVVSAVSLAAVGGGALFLLIAWFRRAIAKDRRGGRTGPSRAERRAAAERLRQRDR